MKGGSFLNKCFTVTKITFTIFIFNKFVLESPVFPAKQFFL